MKRHAGETRIRLKHLANQMREKIYADVRPADSLKVSAPVDRISYKEAQALDYRDCKLGEQFGPQWATFWFRVEAAVPKEWQGKRLDLLWNSNSEATLWLNGQPAQGLNLPYGDRPDAVLTGSAKAGEKISLQVEMACNTIYGIWLEDKSKHISPFVLERCEIALFDSEAWQLYFDFFVLQELEAELSSDGGSSDKAFSGRLLSELNAFANKYDLTDRTTWAPAQKILHKLYENHNGSVSHNVSAIGHAHLDVAWLWPVEETFRKSVRTTASQLAYMKDYPDYSFVFSQAYLYEVMKEQQPELYKQLKAAIAKGRWIPVGGTWVEPDCNLPSGESLARQFLFGQRFFEKEFGKRCTEFWNPDVFGYNGQLPQIMKLSGIERFVTTKLDWNRFNKPTHQTFKWQGIDGSTVLAHFPLAEMFNSNATVKEIRGLATKFKDNDFSQHSMLLYGHGDGGGGPTKAMIETIRRCKDLQGVPRTEMQSPEKFFSLLENELVDAAVPVIVGELYLEYHRGTYTSQAAVKKRMRQCEFLLHDVEFLSSIALRLGLLSYPQAELERLWKLLLVIQFHDIIPGTSIVEVYQRTTSDFNEIEELAARLRTTAASALATHFCSPLSNLTGAPPAASERSINLKSSDAPGGAGVPPAGSECAVNPKRSDIPGGAGVPSASRAHAMRPYEDTKASDRSRSSLSPGSAGFPPAGSECAVNPKRSDIPGGAGVPPASQYIPINTTSFNRREVATTPDGELAIVEAPAYGFGVVRYAPTDPKPTVNSNVSLTETKSTIILENACLRAEISTTGLLTSLIEKQSNRESLAAPGNRLQIYDDHPEKYDAWELDVYHLETVKDCPPAQSYKTTQHELRAEIQFNYMTGTASTMTQIIRLDAESRRLEFHCTMDWQEAHKVLKVMFPVSVRAMNATYEMQFGSVERPTHYNTSYDLARFEVPGHKWSDLSEHGFGVALLSDCKYGFSTYGNEMRLTLLRAPKQPDANADMGQHQFAYALMPHTDSWQDAGVVAEAHHFNIPLLWSKVPSTNNHNPDFTADPPILTGSAGFQPAPEDPKYSLDQKPTETPGSAGFQPASVDPKYSSEPKPTETPGSANIPSAPPPSLPFTFISIDDPNLVLDTIKKAEDSDALILRFYECHGSRGKARISLGLPLKSVHLSNILEDSDEAVPHLGGVIELPYTPFQIITLKVL
jgi:alpha-mannosidase